MMELSINCFILALALTLSGLATGYPRLGSKASDAANIIIRNSNFSLDPCDDFHKFVCGNSNYSIDEIAKFGIEFKMGSMIKDVKSYPTDSKTLAQLRSFYGSCLRRDIQGHEPLVKLLRDLGGFPLLAKKTRWTEQGLDLTSMIIKLARMGLNSGIFFSFNVPHRPSMTIVIQNKNLFHLIEKNKLRNILQTIDPDVDADDIRRESVEMISFIEMLFNDQSEKDMATLSLDELEIAYPNIEWRKLIHGIYSIDSYNDKLRIMLDRKYFNIINGLIRYLNHETLANIVHMSLIHDLGSMFSSTLAQHLPNTSMNCINYIKDDLGFFSAPEYVRLFASPEKRAAVLSMIHFMKDQMVSVIQDTNWITESTKEKAKEKARSIDALVGLPDELYDSDFVESLFGNRSFEEDDFLGNLMKIGQIKLHIDHLSLLNTRWVKTLKRIGYPQEVNAAYSPSYHSITIKTGQIDSLLFEIGRQSFLNFGMVGMAIGHELAHSFDPFSVRYDKNGTRNSWWDEDSAVEYHTREQCFIEQYDSLSVPNAEGKSCLVDGRRTVGENIADNAGYKIAYRSYLKWVEENGPDLQLKGLERFNDKQLFWISLANVWCGHVLVKADKVQSDCHSPRKYRVNIPLRNLKEFSNDFGCPLGTQMNPPTKCSLW